MLLPHTKTPQNSVFLQESLIWFLLQIYLCLMHSIHFLAHISHLKTCSERIHKVSHLYVGWVFFYNYKPLSSIIFPWSNFCMTATHTIKANCHHSFVHLIFYFLYYAVHNFIYIYMGNNTCLPKCSDVILCGCYKHSSFPFCLLFSGFLSNRITIITLISFDTLKKDFRKQGKTPKQTGDINGLLQH